VEDPVFGRDNYQAFAKDVELALLDVEEPEEAQIRKTLPAMAERLSVLHQNLARDVNEWGAQTKEQLDNIKSRLGDI
jgi:ferritin-like metal-binding protein YciE